MEKYEKIPNLSFLEDALMDNENGYRKIKINRAFIKKCLRINGRAMDILYVYDPSMLLDPELLNIAYKSSGPALMRSLATCYRKTIRNILKPRMNRTIHKYGSMVPIKRRKRI